MGQKSIFEDMSGILERRADTFLIDTGRIESSGARICRGPGRRGGREELCNLDLMVS